MANKIYKKTFKMLGCMFLFGKTGYTVIYIKRLYFMIIQNFHKLLFALPNTTFVAMIYMMLFGLHTFAMWLTLIKVVENSMALQVFYLQLIVVPVLIGMYIFLKSNAVEFE